jgi:polyisoprenoid-binding protein YceI
MTKVFYPLVAAAILLTSAISINAVDYRIKDSHSVKFSSKDPKGEFKEMNGTVKFDENDLDGSKISLTFNVASISTGNGMMNKKAQTEEWFNGTKYPQITYVSSKIEKNGNDYTVIGTLTIKGVAKEKKIPMKVIKTDGDLTFTGSFKLNRMDYKVGKKSDAVPDNMDITYSIPLAKK